MADKYDDDEKIDNREPMRRYRRALKAKGYTPHLIYLDAEADFKIKRYAEINELNPWRDFSDIVKRLF